MQQDSANTIYREDCHDLSTWTSVWTRLEDYRHILLLRITILKFKSYWRPEKNLFVSVKIPAWTTELVIYVHPQIKQYFGSYVESKCLILHVWLLTCCYSYWYYAASSILYGMNWWRQSYSLSPLVDRTSCNRIPHSSSKPTCCQAKCFFFHSHLKLNTYVVICNFPVIDNVMLIIANRKAQEALFPTQETLENFENLII